MNDKHYIIAGPTGCGNIFAIYRSNMLPAGKFAICHFGEYANGGSGPITSDGILYDSRENAEEALARMDAMTTRTEALNK